MQSDNVNGHSSSQLPALNIAEISELKSIARIHSKMIYLASVFSLCIAIVSLYFISITVSVNSLSIVRPTTEVSIIRTPANGRIMEIAIRENQPVQKDEMLFVIESEMLNEKEGAFVIRMEDAERMIHDLKHLTTSIEPHPTDSLSTIFYRQSLQSFNQQMLEAKTRYNKAKADYNRIISYIVNGLLLMLSLNNTNLSWRGPKMSWKF